MLTQICQYEGTGITFQNGDSLMVNATEMAKPFNKRPAHWQELPSTKDFLFALQQLRTPNTYENSTAGKSDSWIRTAEGNKGGTWFHEDVALEFARWLSPAFGIWCNDRIKEIIRGNAAPAQKAVTLDTLLSSPDVLLIVLRKLTDTEIETVELKRKLASMEARKAYPGQLYPKRATAEDIHALRTEGQALHDYLQSLDMSDRLSFARACRVSVGTLRNYATGNGKKVGTLRRLIAAIPTVAA